MEKVRVGVLTQSDCRFKQIKRIQRKLTYHVYGKQSEKLNCAAVKTITGNASHRKNKFNKRMHLKTQQNRCFQRVSRTSIPRPINISHFMTSEELFILSMLVC